MLVYCEEQFPFELTDYLGNKYVVDDFSGSCVLPTTYELGRAEDYIQLTSESSKRAVFVERGDNY